MKSQCLETFQLYHSGRRQLCAYFNKYYHKTFSLRLGTDVNIRHSEFTRTAMILLSHTHPYTRIYLAIIYEASH